MSITVVPTAFGRPALLALREVVSEAKAGNALAPVTVIVPTNIVGITARRLLGSGAVGSIVGDQAGVAGLTMLTQYRLAELLGAPALAAQQRQPVSTPVIAATVRTALEDVPGMFAAVRHHPSTERALVATHRELSELTSEELDRLASQGARLHDVVRLHRFVRSHLSSGWYDEHDLMHEALHQASADRLTDFGHLVLHLPKRVTTASAALLRHLGGLTPLTVIAASSGVERADTSIEQLLARLVPHGVPLPRPQPAAGTEVRSFSDADDEVRHVARSLIESGRGGTDLGRVAVLYPTEVPYARLLEEHLGAAGIAYNGSVGRTPDQSLLGRGLLALLALPDSNFRRDQVTALFASAPMRLPTGAPVPSAAWERISRSASVLSGAEQWSQRLTRFVDDQRMLAEAEAGTENREWLIARFERHGSWAEQLAAYIDQLINQLEPARFGRSWKSHVAHTRRLIGQFFGGPTRREDWPGEERRSVDLIEAALDRLSLLDSVETAPTSSVFRRALVLELESALPKVGVFGTGVFIGRTIAAVGMDLDAVFVLGMAEGVFPGRQREDSLVPDRDRAILGDVLPRKGARTNDDHRDLLAALAASSGPRVLSYPRGDLRRNAERMPSRWALDTIESCNDGVRVWAEDLATVADRPWFSETPSFLAGLRRMDFPATPQEFDVRSLLDHPGELADHPLTANRVFGRGNQLAAARASSDFTRFDGNLSELPLPSLTDPTSISSPTRLEVWPSCPHRYLLEVILRVGEIEDPTRELQITALDRGSLVHDILDRFLDGELEASAIPDPGHRWPDAARRRLDTITTDLFRTYEQRGLVGKAVYWDREQRIIRRDLDRFLAADETFRAEHASTPARTEYAFGVRGIEPITVPLPDGRTVRLRGAVDRIDTRGDSHLVVIDYKTGSTRPFDEMKKEPLVRGTKLQLPVYALAARAAADDPEATVHSTYWFITTRGEFKAIGYDVSSELLGEFATVLQAITTGIERGVFPQHPDDPERWSGFRGCPSCDPDGLGTRSSYTRWQRKQHAPELRPYAELIDPERLHGV